MEAACFLSKKMDHALDVCHSKKEVNLTGAF